MIETIQDEATLRPYVESFEDLGFAHFRAAYTAAVTTGPWPDEPQSAKRARLATSPRKSRGASGR